MSRFGKTGWKCFCSSLCFSANVS